MAYPTVDAPYGFKPVSLLGGRVYSGSTRQIPIASGHATNIYYGDVVVMSANGCINNAIFTSIAVNGIGIFQGCSYVNSAGQRVYSQYYPATVSQTVDSPNQTLAYVVDDVQAVFKVAIVSGTTVIAQAARSSLVGGNVALVTTTGSTITGDSKQAVLNAAGTVTTCPFQIIDVVPDTAVAVGSFVEVLVIWNTGTHQYSINTGV